MSDLRTLFISQSYTSLIHTSNDDAVPTGSYIELEDGAGNSLGIEVNRDGNFKIQGELSASLVNGIGNVTVYSASVDNRLDQLESDTGSQDNRLDLLEEFTSSQEQINLIVNNFTSSQEDKNTTLETVTSSLQQSVDSLEVFTASLETNFVTSASFQEYTSSIDQKISSLNDFTSSQLTINGGYNSFTQSADSRLDSLETFTGSLSASQVGFVTQSTSLTSSNVQDAITELDMTKAPISALSSNLIVYPTTATSSIAGYSILVTSPDEVGYNTTAVDVPTGTISGSNQFIAALATTGSLFQGNPGVINITTLGNVRRTGGGPNSSADFYFEVYKRSGSVETLIGTSNNTTEVNAETYEQFFATALLTDGTFTEDDVIVTKYYGSLINPAGADPSFDFQFGGEEPIRTLIPVPASVITDPTLTLRVNNLEIFSASQETINDGYNEFTQSADNRLNSIESETGSYARTDIANNFTGSQTFDLPFDFETKPDGDSDSVFKVDNFQNRIQISLVSDDTFSDREIRFYPSASYSPGYPQDSELGFTIREDGVFTYDNAMGITNTSDEKLLQFRIEDDGDGDNFRIYFNNSLIQEVTYDNDFKIYPNINTVGGIDTNAPCNFLGGAEVQGGFTASMGEGNVFVGGGDGKSIELPTSSLSGNSATLSGNNTFDGNQTISGSVNGNVEVITIASSTASIDCSLGNFFTITLPTGSTHFTATNIEPGQTVSVKVATQNNTTASIDSGTIKMLGGVGYTPTQSGSEDILTFVSYDSSFLYGVVGRFFG